MSPRFSPSELFLKAQTDERLVALAAEGHGRAFAVLIERHRRPLMAHARRLVGPEREEDVVQQALLRAWTSLERGAEVRHAQAWLHRIVHNTALTEITRQAPPAEPLDEQLVDPRSAATAAEQRLQVREVLLGVSALPERQRLALLGTELEGRSRRQLAAELGLTEGAIRQLVHRARDGVRAAVAAFIPFPLIVRGMRASGWLSGTGGSAALRPAGETAAASGLATGAIIKAGTAVLAVGAVGGLVLHAGHGHARHTVTRRPTVHQSARAAGRAPLRHPSVIDTAMRKGPVVVHAVVAEHHAVPSARHQSSPAGGLAPAIPQPQTYLPPVGGSHPTTGDSRRGTSRDSSGSGGDRSRSGTGITGGSSGTSSTDHHPSKDSTGSAGTDRSSSPSPSSDSTNSSGSSSDSTSPSGSAVSATSPSGSSSDSTNTSSGSDSSTGQSTTTSSSTTTSTTPTGGD